MRLTYHTDYAIRTLIYLALNTDKMTTIGDISHIYGISKNHMMKVVQKLVHHGYISSERGRNGGIKLLLEPADIKLGDVIEKMETDLNLVACFDKNNHGCKIDGVCQVQGFFSEALNAFLDVMNQYSLEDAVKGRLQLLERLTVESRE